MIGSLQKKIGLMRDGCWRMEVYSRIMWSTSLGEDREKDCILKLNGTIIVIKIFMAAYQYDKWPVYT